MSEAEDPSPVEIVLPESSALVMCLRSPSGELQVIEHDILIPEDDPSQAPPIVMCVRKPDGQLEVCTQDVLLFPGQDPILLGDEVLEKGQATYHTANNDNNPEPDLIPKTEQQSIVCVRKEIGELKIYDEFGQELPNYDEPPTPSSENKSVRMKKRKLDTHKDAKNVGSVFADLLKKTPKVVISKAEKDICLTAEYKTGKTKTKKQNLKKTKKQKTCLDIADKKKEGKNTKPEPTVEFEMPRQASLDDFGNGDEEYDYEPLENGEPAGKKPQNTELDADVGKDEIKNGGVPKSKNKKFQKKPGKTYAYFCDKCGKGFEKIGFRDHHVAKMVCSSKKEKAHLAFNCAHCGIKLHSRLSLRKHQMQTCGRYNKQEDDTFLCKCEKVFNEEKEVLDHLGEMECVAILVKQDGSMEVTRKFDYKSKMPKAQCLECKKWFRNQDSLKTHMVIHGEYRPYMCEICGKGFNQKGNYHQHVLKVHEKDVPGYHLTVKELKDRKYVCGVCGKVLSTKVGMDYHEKTHLNEKPFNCTHCKVGFRERRWLDHHNIKNIDKHPRVCIECKQIFVDNATHQKHINEVHNKDFLGYKIRQEHKCEICSIIFARNGMLTYHKWTVHKIKVPPKEGSGGSAVYRCEHCEKFFLCKMALRMHRRLHAEPKFRCETCNKPFYSKWNLNVHERKHTGEKPYNCDGCGRRFADMSNLKHHKDRSVSCKDATKTCEPSANTFVLVIAPNE